MEIPNLRTPAIKPVFISTINSGSLLVFSIKLGLKYELL